MFRQGATRWLWMMILVLSNILTVCVVTFYMCERNPRYNYVIRNRMYDYLYWGESFTLKRYMEVPFRGFLPPSESVCDCSKKSTTSTTIHVVTHTYKRVTQKVDLTILCQSLALVDNVVWIVVEDSDSRTELVSRLLSRCPVKSVHLFAECVHAWWSISWLGSHRRGVTQWNTGLKWLRSTHGVSNCDGVVYFSDDYTKLNIKLFNKIRRTKSVSVWPVDTGSTKQSGTTLQCQTDQSVYKPVNDSAITRSQERSNPLHMGSIVVQLCLLMQHPEAILNNGIFHSNLEVEFINKLLTRSQKVECMSEFDNEVLAWTFKTKDPFILHDQSTLEV